MKAFIIILFLFFSSILYGQQRRMPTKPKYTVEEMKLSQTNIYNDAKQNGVSKDSLIILKNHGKYYVKQNKKLWYNYEKDSLAYISYKNSYLYKVEEKAKKSSSVKSYYYDDYNNCKYKEDSYKTITTVYRGVFGTKIITIRKNTRTGQTVDVHETFIPNKYGIH
jgi:hypothetical protein